MNNRFKFRAMTKSVDIWNNQVEPQMIYGEGFMIDKSGCIQIWKQEDTGTNNYIVDSDTLMQCTGLKDKNDKLIYEGDILDGSWATPNDPMPFCVKWYDIHAGFNLMGLNTEEFEIIGNIYEKEV